jgi:hypothetical protein
MEWLTVFMWGWPIVSIVVMLAALACGLYEIAMWAGIALLTWIGGLWLHLVQIMFQRRK